MILEIRSTNDLKRNNFIVFKIKGIADVLLSMTILKTQVHNFIQQFFSGM